MLKRLWSRLWRGVLMGIAEVVPGVSGGTIALLTGIYRELVDAIASFGPASVLLLGSPRVFYERHQMEFLLSLAFGMGLGIILFANLMRYLMAEFAPPVWAFFFCVIIVSAVLVASARKLDVLLRWGVPGLAAGIVMLFLPSLGESDSLLLLFAGGAIAVCAWILPAVSGSYMMLLLGLYERVIGHISDLDLLPLAVLAGGCVVGLLSFVRVLGFLLRRYYEQTLSLLAGFMLGSTINLWPWRASTDGVTRWLWPAEYAALGEPPLVAVSFVSGLLGGLGLWLLARRTKL